MSQQYWKSKKRRILAVFFAVSFIVTISLSNALMTNQLSFGIYVNAQNSNVSQLVNKGIKYYDNGKFREAVEEWETALEIYQKNKQLPQQAIVRGNLARGYQKLGDLEQTVKQWQQLVTLHRQLENRRETGRALTELSQAYSSLGKKKKAIELLCGVEETGEKLNCLPGSALEIAKSQKDRQGIVAALGSIGEAYRKLASDELAIKYLKEAEKISGTNQNYLILNSLGNVYFSQALLWNLRAESARTSLPNKYTEFVNQAKYSYQNAHQRFADSLQIAIDKNDESAQMAAMINLIQLYSRSRQFNLFDENQLNQVIQKALTVLDELPDSTQKVYAAIDLANLPGSNIVNPPLTQCAIDRQYSRKLPSAKVETLLNQSVQIAEYIQDYRSQSFALGAKGHFYECQGNYNQALDLTRKALIIAEQNLKSKDSLYLWEWQTGRILLQKGDESKAMEAYERAFQTLEKIRTDILTANKDFQLDFRDVIQPIYRKLAELKLVQNSQNYVSQQDGIFSEQDGIFSQPDGIFSEQDDIFSEQDGIVSEQDGILREQDGIVSEQDGILREQDGIVREQDGIVSEQDGIVSEQDGIVSEQDGIVSEQDARTTNLISQQKANKQDTKVSNNLNDARNIIDSLRLAELQNYFGNECILAAIKQQQVDQLLGNNTAVFSSVILENRAAIVLNLPEGKSYFRWIKQENGQSFSIQQLNKLIEDFRKSLVNAPLDFDYDTEQAANLYNLLIKPFDKQIKTAQINTFVFVQDGFFRSIPMAALYDSKDKKYFIEKFAIANTPSLRLTAPQKLNTKTSRALITGVSQPADIDGQKYRALSNVSKEIASVQKIFPKTETLYNENFTLDNLREKLNKTAYPIIHIATHAQFGIIPEETYLVAGNNQKLTISELEEVLRKFTGGVDSIELLSLTACQTAVGDERATLGLAGIALQVGVRSVLASLWALPDESTSILVEEFYQNLRGGKSKAEALQQAQIKLLQAKNLDDVNNQYDNPGYWAPFIMIGNWL
ncbi:MAG: CHAT domain-containing protein [Rivularia sp. (in: cyanobacteria)]